MKHAEKKNEMEKLDTEQSTGEVGRGVTIEGATNDFCMGKLHVVSNNSTTTFRLPSEAGGVLGPRV